MAVLSITRLKPAFGLAAVYVIARLEVAFAPFASSFGSREMCEDRLPSFLIPSVALGDRSDRVLAEIDQNGFVFAVDKRDQGLFSANSMMTARKHHRLQIILRGGRVYLRKIVILGSYSTALHRVLDFLAFDFYVEAAALLRLRQLSSVPVIRRVLRRTATIEMDYIWGQDLRQMLANGHNEIDYEDIARSFLAMVDGGCQNRITESITEIVCNVISCGVIPRDIHAANFIKGHQSGKLYMVDFNFVHLRPAPGWRFHVRGLVWLLKDRGDRLLGS